jgi:hypothetical protein
MTINDNLEFGMHDTHKHSSFGTPTQKEKNSYNISNKQGMNTQNKEEPKCDANLQR